jgi:hypothetical protein
MFSLCRPACCISRDHDLMHQSFDTRVRVLDMRIGLDVSTEPAQGWLLLVMWCYSGNNKAASILLYHIVKKPYTASQLTNGLSLETELSGYNLSVSINSTGSVRQLQLVLYSNWSSWRFLPSSCSW